MSGLLLFIAVLVAVGWSVLQGLLVDEISASLPVVTRRVLRLAGRRLPSEFRERYQEEWRAELDALGDRRLTALGYSVMLLMRAGSLRQELAISQGRDFGRSRTRTATMVDVSFPAAPGRRPSRTGPLVDWEDVLEAMRDPNLGDVDDELQPAETRFSALLVSPAELALQQFRAGAAERRARAAYRIPIAGRSTPIHLPQPVEPPPSHVRWPRRYGPNGRVDPDWRIAPLTRAERRVAERYRQVALGFDESAECDWPHAARRALLMAIDDYDSQHRFRHAAPVSPGNHAVRLDVFLEAWTPSHMAFDPGTE